MRKTFTATGLLLPVSAFAHGSAEFYYLCWWYFAVMLFIVCFLFLGTCSLKRKAYSVGGLLLLTTLAWTFIANVDVEVDPKLDGIILGALGLIPVMGFILGLQFKREKKNAI